MLTFTQYVEKAKEKQNYKTKQEVANKLGMKTGSLIDFEKGRAFPSQDTIISLANLAGISPEQALIDFNLWKTKDKPNAHKVWLRLSKMIGCLLLSILINPHKTNAYNPFDLINLTNIQSPSEQSYLYYEYCLA